jgi:Cu/Ag efflux protein CusF
MGNPSSYTRPVAARGRSARGALAACVLIGAAACGPRAPAAPDAIYTARGEITKIDAATREVYVHHEALPEFRDEQGAVVGMESMSMPFTPGPGIDLGALTVGQRVEFEFGIRWRAAPRLELRRATPLPPGTRLAFDEAEPDGSPETDQAPEPAPR